MANLSTFSLLKEKVKNYKEDYALETPGSAFIWLGLETILNLNENEIEDAVTDGSMDGGIDAIHIINKDVHIFNFKYTEVFENTQKNFPETEIDKLIVTVERIFDKSISKDDVNDVLWEKIVEIWELFNKSSLNFKFYLCSNKLKPLDHAMRKFENKLDRFRFVEFNYFDQEDLVVKLLERKFKKVNGKFNFIDKQYFDRSDGPLKGVVATLSATDLIDLIKDPHDSKKVNEEVFNENVRIYHKKNRMNQGIVETALSDDNYEFWYLNNGITIVCEACDYTPNMRSPKVTLTNFQIVNGGQTSHALFEAYLREPSKMENVLLLVKIYETKQNYHISEKISETTNKQTPVTTRDLHSNDRIQKKIEGEFRSLGYYYERKKNQFADQPKNKRLNNELLGQIYLAYYLDMPSESRNQKALVFGDKYDEVFNEDTITAGKMLVPYKIYIPIEDLKREVQRKKRKKESLNEREGFISFATFHILNLVKYIAMGEKLDLNEEKNMDLAIKKAIDMLSIIVKSMRESLGDEYSHTQFFKETGTNRILLEKVKQQYSHTNFLCEVAPTK